MPDYSFIAQPKTSEAMQTFSSIVNTARGMTDLQRARETMQADIARAKAESSSAESAASLAQQTLAPKVEQQAAQTAQSKTAASLAQWKLDSDQAGRAYEIAAGLAQDPSVNKGDSAGIVRALMQAEDMMRSHKIPDDKIKVQIAPLYLEAAKNPGGVRQMLDNIIRSQSGASAQATVANAPVTPVQAQSGAIAPLQLQPGAPGGVQPVPISSLQPGAGGAAPAPNAGVIPPGIAPTNLESIETGPDQNKYIVQRSQNGTIISTRPLSQAGAPSAGGGPARMPTISPEDQASRPVLEGERNQARTILSSAPIAHETNRGILRELDNVIATGTLGPVLSRVASTLGAKFDTPEQKASAYDLIGKYTERNALEAAKAMGPGTNAGLEAAIKANGSAAYNPTALKKITKLNDAIMSGAEAYQPGLEKAISSNPERGVLVKREYDQAWAQNFDPRVMEIANAAKAGDKKTLDEIVKQAGGRGSATAKELIQKARNIESLSTTGRLP